MSITCSCPDGHFETNCLFCSMLYSDLSPYRMWGDNNYQDRKQKWTRATNKEDLKVEKKFKKQNKIWGTRKEENHPNRQLHWDYVKRPKGGGETHWPTLFPFPKVLPDGMPGNGGTVLKVLAGGLRSLTVLPPAWEPPQALVTWHLQTGHSSFSEPQKWRLSRPEGTTELIWPLTLT